MNTEERSNIGLYGASSPLPSPMGSTNEVHATSSSFQGTDQHQFFSSPEARSNFRATERQHTGQPSHTETSLEPPFPVIYPPYMNYPNVPYVPFHTMSTMIPASVHFDPLSSSAGQPSSSRLRVLAPKVPLESAKSAAEGFNLGKQPDFIETVRAIRQQLFEKARLKETDEPTDVEPRVYSEWRKTVSEAWKPVSISFPLLFLFYNGRF